MQANFQPHNRGIEHAPREENQNSSTFAFSETMTSATTAFQNLNRHEGRHVGAACLFYLKLVSDTHCSFKTTGHIFSNICTAKAGSLEGSTQS